ncbi:cytidylate kinase-like family protein [Candidatus Chlorohelix sp.]|uniref:cytidylate kinase-like family protein n=1 Tax=Candidatus Chlorohelix sp. TaxID=3139201 RepID=UPI00306EF8E9
MTVTRMVITISHEEGSGGRAIAQELAKTLKLSYVDSHAIKTAATHLQIPEEDLAEFDEKILPRMKELRQLIVKPDISLSKALAPDRDVFGLVKEEKPILENLARVEEDKRMKILSGYHVLVERLIKEAATAGHVVIMGRGANFILKGWQGVTNIHLHAPLQDRIERIAFLHHIDKDIAAQEIAREDGMRSQYIRQYFEADWLDPDNYHLVINTVGLSLSSVAAIIEHYVKESQQAQANDPLVVHRTYDRLKAQESYSLKEAAAVLLTDSDLIQQAVYRGELKATVMNHNVTRISREALAEWAMRYRAS